MLEINLQKNLDTTLKIKGGKPFGFPPQNYADFLSMILTSTGSSLLPIPKFRKKRITFINIFGLFYGTKGAGVNLSSSATLSNKQPSFSHYTNKSIDLEFLVYNNQRWVPRNYKEIREAARGSIATGEILFLPWINRALSLTAFLQTCRV